MNEKGFTLIESVAATAILGFALLGILASFQTMSRSNTLHEQRSNAVAAATQVVEQLRRQPPASLPTSGSSAIQSVTVGQHTYEVVAHYCRKPTYCTADMRHVIVEVNFAGKTIYTIETVYTRLQ
jgi:prepilin-type N-terminal cleavage/methylation domain-containing protein